LQPVEDSNSSSVLVLHFSGPFFFWLFFGWLIQKFNRWQNTRIHPLHFRNPHFGVLKVALFPHKAM